MTAPVWASARRARPRVGRALWAWAAAAFCLLAGSARAQVSVSLTAQSDYLLRGVSLSDGRPTLGMDLDLDDRSGFYADVQATAADTRRNGVELLSVVADVGYARRLANGVTVDAGMSDSQISTFADERYDANYVEVYAGVARGGLSARLYVSPDYLGESARTIYLDVSETVRPAAHWRLTAHAGLLDIVDGDAASFGGRSHVDVSAGVARDLGRFEARLTASWAEPPPVYPAGISHGRGALVAALSAFF